MCGVFRLYGVAFALVWCDKRADNPAQHATKDKTPS